MESNSAEQPGQEETEAPKATEVREVAGEGEPSPYELERIRERLGNTEPDVEDSVRPLEVQQAGPYEQSSQLSEDPGYPAREDPAHVLNHVPGSGEEIKSGAAGDSDGIMGEQRHREPDAAVDEQQRHLNGRRS